jgi:hypothetical protein
MSTTRGDAQGRAETERLLLVPRSEGYSGEFARVLQDPEAMRFISSGTPLPRIISATAVGHLASRRVMENAA